MRLFGPGGSIRQLHQLFDSRIHPKTGGFFIDKAKVFMFFLQHVGIACAVWFFDPASQKMGQGFGNKKWPMRPGNVWKIIEK